MFYSPLREKQFPVTVVALRDIALKTKELELEMPPDFQFEAGQYIWVELHGKMRYHDDRGTRRAFSLASNDEHPKRVRIIFRETQSGYIRSLSSLKPKEKVFIIGPHGSSIKVKKTMPHVVFVYGGMGVAPFYSILRSPKSLAEISKATLLAFNRSPQAFPYRDEMEALVKTIPRISYQKFYRHPDRTDFEKLAKANPATWFITGPELFVNEVYKHLQSLGVKEAAMHFGENHPTLKKHDHIKSLTHSPVESNRIFHLVSEEASNHIIITDENGRIFYANHAAEEMTGYTFEEMQHRTPRLWGGLMPREFYETLWKTIKSGKVFTADITNRRKNGVLYTAIVRITPLTDELRHIIGFLATEEDISGKAEAEKVKTEFISLASHQLRTPITGIGWYTEMLLSGDAGPISKKQKRFLKEIYLNNKRAISLIDSLLNVSRLELGTFKPEPEWIRVDEVAKEVINDQKYALRAKRLVLHQQIIKNVPEIYADSDLIRIVMQNLISNAIKYSSNSGRIVFGMTVDHRRKHVLLKVADVGIGIPEDQKIHIFDKLFRASNVKEMQGTGLGLYLTKTIVDRMHGKIWFESVKNRGTTFYVTIPVKKRKGQKGTKR